MIFITGDTHIPVDVHKLNSKNFPEGNELTKNDYVIVCGDFGLLFNCLQTGICIPSNPMDKCWNPEEINWKNWLDEKPWTTLFVDGNHENFDRLNTYPVEMWNGGKVQKITDSIIHLMRGQIYEIDGNTFFTFGGAKSHDRGPATGTEKYDRGLIWWDEEMPTLQEMNEGRANLAMAGNKVDYIISHDAPTKELVGLSLKTRRYFNTDYLNAYLEDIRIETEYKHWFSGHYHEDIQLSAKHTMLYYDILKLGDDIHVH